MLQRIRYDKKEGKLVSREVYSNKGSKYMVFIDLQTMTYIIRNVLSLRKYEGGKGINNLTVLKRNVKKHLSHLGVPFGREVRQRTFGICEKGYSQAKEIQKRREQKHREEGLKEMSKLTQELEKESTNN